MYTRVFEKILDSSLMSEDVETRWLFLTMLILGDRNRDGIINMPVDRLALRASLSVEQTEKALARLMAPDDNSESKVEGGRRLVSLDPEHPIRGWVIVNYVKYKKTLREEDRKKQNVTNVRRFRERHAELEAAGLSKPGRHGLQGRHVLQVAGPSAAKAPTSAPTEAEVKALATARGFHASPEKYWLNRQAAGWRRPNGAPIIDWEADFAAYEAAWVKNEEAANQPGRGPSAEANAAEIARLQRETNAARAVLEPGAGGVE